MKVIKVGAVLMDNGEVVHNGKVIGKESDYKPWEIEVVQDLNA